MNQGHLDRKELLALLGGELPDRDLRVARDHVFDCSACELGVAEALSDLVAETGQGAASASSPSGKLERAQNAALGALRVKLDQERREADQLFRRLGSEGEPLLALDADFRTWGFFEHLIDEARALVTSRPQRARTLLQLALRVAARLDRAVYGRARVETAKVRGWAHLGNIQRVLGDYDAAEKTFRRAEFHYWQSDLDPLDEARLLEFRAVLCRHQSRFDEAIELIDGAIAICKEVNEPHREGRAQMVRAIVHLYAGRPDLAADEFSQSLVLLDPTQDPHLPAYCLLNQVLCLTEADRASEAADLLPEVKRQAEAVTLGSADLLRVRWIEARVDLGLGRLEEAEAALRRIQTLFVEGNLVVDAALVTLDLAALLVRARRTAEIPELVQEMIPVFQSLQIRREALAALLVLQQAAEAERLTLALVRETVASVRISSASPAAQVKA